MCKRLFFLLFYSIITGLMTFAGDFSTDSFSPPIEVKKVNRAVDDSMLEIAKLINGYDISDALKKNITQLLNEAYQEFRTTCYNESYIKVYDIDHKTLIIGGASEYYQSYDDSNKALLSISNAYLNAFYDVKRNLIEELFGYFQQPKDIFSSDFSASDISRVAEGVLRDYLVFNTSLDSESVYVMLAVLPFPRKTYPEDNNIFANPFYLSNSYSFREINFYCE